MIACCCWDVCDLCEWSLAGPLSDHTQRQISKRPASNTRRASDRDLGPMRSITRELLTVFYSPFNQKLTEVLQDESFTWNTSHQTWERAWGAFFTHCVNVAGSVFVNDEVYREKQTVFCLLWITDTCWSDPSNLTSSLLRSLVAFLNAGFLQGLEKYGIWFKRAHFPQVDIIL